MYEYRMINFPVPPGHNHLTWAPCNDLPRYEVEGWETPWAPFASFMPSPIAGGPVQLIWSVFQRRKASDVVPEFNGHKRIVLEP